MLILMTEEFYRFMLNCFKIHNIFTILSFISVLFPIKLFRFIISRKPFLEFSHVFPMLCNSCLILGNINCW